MVVSVGMGTVVPALNKISAPIVCADGRLEVGQSSMNPRPGETYVSLAISCVDEASGASEVKTIPAILVSGIFYSLVIFVPSFIWFIKHPDSWGMVDDDGEIIGKSKSRKKS